MKRHALFFATALAVASLGSAGLALAQSAPAAPAADAPTDTPRAVKGERMSHDGPYHSAHRGGHAMHDGDAMRGGYAMHDGDSMRGGIERMDSDGDGRISRAEFDAAKATREEARATRMAEREKAGAGESPRRARGDGPARGDGARGGMGQRMMGQHMMGQRMAFDFDAIDANKDGYIVRSEVMAHHDRMREQMREMREQRFAEAFAAADLDKDGKLSRVEVDEKMPRLSKRFAWMDDNRDGFLSRDEIEAGKRR